MSSMMSSNSSCLNINIIIFELKVEIDRYLTTYVFFTNFSPSNLVLLSSSVEDFFLFNVEVAGVSILVDTNLFKLSRAFLDCLCVVSPLSSVGELPPFDMVDSMAPTPLKGTSP